MDRVDGLEHKYVGSFPIFSLELQSKSTLLSIEAIKFGKNC